MINFTSINANTIFTSQLSMLSSSHMKCHIFFSPVFILILRSLVSEYLNVSYIWFLDCSNSSFLFLNLKKYNNTPAITSNNIIPIIIYNVRFDFSSSASIGVSSENVSSPLDPNCGASIPPSCGSSGVPIQTWLDWHLESSQSEFPSPSLSTTSVQSSSW